LTNIAYPDTTSATYGYDALSRLTSAANQNGAVSFTYDSRNRITSTTDVWGQTIGYGYDAKFGLRFEVIGSVSEGKIGHIGQGSTSIDLRNGGQWTIGQWVYPFSGSKLDGIPPRGVGATSDDSPLYLEGSSGEPTVAVHGRRFAWHDQPGFYDLRNLPPTKFYSLSANFLVYAQNGDKRCEVRFHIWQRYEKGVLTTGVSPGNL
jgi:YD repeat-containing protein